MKKNQNIIKHTGKVIFINEEKIQVEIINKSACASCHAKSMCSISDMKNKIIDINNTGNYNIRLADEVLVCLAESLGIRAVLIIYLIPLILLLILLLSLPKIFDEELFVGLGIISALGLYYFVIYLFRSRLAKKYVFYIEPRMGK